MPAAREPACVCLEATRVRTGRSCDVPPHQSCCMRDSTATLSANQELLQCAVDMLTRTPEEGGPIPSGSESPDRSTVQWRNSSEISMCGRSGLFSGEGERGRGGISIRMGRRFRCAPACRQRVTGDGHIFMVAWLSVPGLAMPCLITWGSQPARRVSVPLALPPEFAGETCVIIFSVSTAGHAPMP